MTEIELRRAQLAARKGKSGYRANCEALEQRIAELKGQQNG